MQRFRNVSRGTGCGSGGGGGVTTDGVSLAGSPSMRASGMTSSNSGGGIADDDDEDPKVATTRGSAALPRWLITFGFSTVVVFVFGSGCVVVIFVVRGVRSVVVSVESGHGCVWL